MKGRLYRPIIPDSEHPNGQLEEETFQNTFKYPLKDPNQKKSKINTRDYSPVRFMWKTSIPSSWFKLAHPTRFQNVIQTKLKQRSTLTFLEETQKYIYNIRKPLISKTTIQLKTLKKPKSQRRTKKNMTRVLSERKLCCSDQDIHFGLFKCNKQELLPRYTSQESLYN
ncbi:hypothetical protein SteCoe_36568 [Stentor coeruleus]|uniref:Uncharacterized protein n=1 Tax=Stentor coeruleus TaxID=5963 RepID=A0A1R2APT3_9CILI|nr:hypothetical protein SteCoe_36568 [Stentor coeruleus]